VRHAGTRVTVIIVNYRTADLTKLAALSALADGADEVIIVDNNSDDGSLERFGSTLGSRTTVVMRDTNGGFGSGANTGARLASGDILVFLNSDAKLKAGALEALVAEAGMADGRILVGPRVLEDDGRVQRSAGLLPKPDDLLVRGLGLHRVARAVSLLPGIGGLLGRSRMAAEYNTTLTAASPADVSMISGACVAVGRAAFETMGGFDERYFMYFEDADLCRRATALGWPVRYLPAAEVVHTGGASSTRNYQLGLLHGPAMVLYLKRWYGSPGGILALWILALRALWGIAAGRDEAPEALVGGARAYLAGRITVRRPRSTPSP